MNASELVRSLEEEGIQLWREGEELRYWAPKGLLTQQLLEALAARKPEIIELLQRPSASEPCFQDRRPPALTGQEYPLSFAQQRMWFLRQLDPESCALNVAMGFFLSGRLNVTALQSSLNDLVARHEAFRTTCGLKDGVPVQVIAPPDEGSDSSLAVIDLRAIPESEQQAELKRQVESEAQRPFDFENLPLLRSTVFQLAEDRWALVLSTHHFVVDGWSVGVLFRDLSALYNAHAAGRPVQLGKLAIRYCDYARRRREHLKGSVLDELLAYWKKQLDGLAELNLPSDRPAPAVPSGRGAVVHFELPQDLSDALKALSRREGVTLFMTLLAAFKTLLHRYSRQDDIVVGTAVSDRYGVETQALVGCFANTLVLRTGFAGRPTFRQVLRRVHDSSLGAFDHQDLPFEILVQQLRPERLQVRNPLFQVSFFLHQRAGDETLNFDGVAAHSLPIQPGMSRSDVVLELWDKRKRLSGIFEFNTDLFDEATIRRMAGHFQNLLEAIVADPQQTVSDLPMLSAAEREELVVGWNETEADYPRGKCFDELFPEQAGRTPEAVAVECEGRALSYRELDARSSELAGKLRTLGVGPEVLVGICMERSVEMLVGILGIMKAGGAYVPLDPGYPRERLDHIIEDAQPGVILSQESLKGELLEGVAGVVCFEELGGLESGVLAGREERSLENLVYVLYTSGSTGKPKGVEISHGALVNFLSSMEREPGMGAQEVMLAVTTLAFDIAGLELFLPLMVGARVVIASSEIARDGAKLRELLERSGASVMQGTPASWKMLLEAGWEGDGRLKVLCGGEAWTQELAGELLKRCGALWNMYGPTETTIWSAVSPVEAGKPVVVGGPIANTSFYILDEHRQSLPVGVPGELYIGGESVARGYHNRPELTAERFVCDPFGAQGGGRLYRTGDLARYRADGRIEFLGRLDDQVKIRGFRIELGEIEAALRQSHGVGEAVVVAREDGAGDRHLVGYVVAREQNEVSPAPLTEEAEKQWIEEWREVWDEHVYSKSAQTLPDPTFNTQGWISTYTGQPIPETEMREWLDDAVDRIRSFGAQQVLEIGCGTGMILFQIAPGCQRYFASDISASAIDYVRRHLHLLDTRRMELELARRSADNFAGRKEQEFDAVVLNSVAQYFPNIEYLKAVIEKALKVVRPGGHLFLGDIRSLPLHQAFQTSVQWHRAKDEVTIGELRGRIASGQRQEEELLIDPAFFYALQQSLPQIGQVEILPKRGTSLNELTKFRYQVVLHIEESSRKLALEEWHDWEAEGLSLAWIEETLRQKRPECLAISGIPNHRLDQEKQLLEILSQAQETQTVGELKARIATLKAVGVTIEQLEQAAAATDYGLQLSWAAHDRRGNYQVVFSQRAHQQTGRTQFPNGRGNLHSLQEYANRPLRRRAMLELATQLRGFLKERLPDYMVPAAIVVLESLPLTPNGKLDRKALPAPDLTASTNPSRAPRTPQEEILCALFAEILGLPRVGTDDNFFELGGHSLLATRLISRVRGALGVELPVRTIFEAPIVSELACRLGAAQEHPRDDPGRTSSFERPASGFEPIVPDPGQRNAAFPMTELQTAYWVGQDGSLQAGNIPNIYFEIDCHELDVGRLEAAWQKLIERHDMLHAIVTSDGLIHVLEEAPIYRIEVSDLRGRLRSEVEKELEAARSRMSHRGRRAGQWPPFEIRVAQFDDDGARLFMSFDIIFTDGWSNSIIFSEWRKFYEKPQTTLPPLRVTFRDYVVALERQRDAAPVQRAREYWKKRLNELPSGPRLPIKPDISTLRRPQVKRRTVNLAVEDWFSVRRSARKANLTPAAALLTAYSDVLRRWSEEPMFTLNIPLFNREPLHPQVNDVVGDFTSITLLEVREASETATFRERARSLQSQLWRDLDHRQFSGIEVQRELARQTGYMNWTGTPVVFTSLLWSGAGSNSGHALDWLGESVFGLSQTPQVWLDCIVSEVDGGLKLSWDAAELLFPEGMLDAMFKAFSEHVAGLARDDAAWEEAWSDTAQRLIPSDQAEKFESVNDTGAAVSHQLLHELFMDQAASFPDQSALLSSSGSLTYRELDDLSNRLAGWLRSHGARSNTLVAVVMEKGWEQIVAVLGILKAGAAYLPIEAGLPAERLQKLLRHGEVTIALTQGRHIGNIQWPEGVKALALSQEELRALPSERPSGDIRPEDLAYVIYTSGSTGEPKGVMIDHRGAVNTILDINSRFGIGKEDRVLAVSSLSFDLSVYDIFGALAGGAAIVIPEAEGTRDPSHWADLIIRHGVTVWNSVPALMDLVVDYLRGHAGVRPQSLRLALLSGDWIPVSLPEAIANLAGVAEVVSLGGATEASIWSILYPIERVDPAWSSIPYGRPMANQSFQVLDGDLLPCPVWVPGELFIGGIGLAKGYWRNTEQTRASFLSHPLTGERLYRSGDVGRYLPDGNIEFLGRKDTQVKLQGFRAELGEIEATLSSHPGVSAAAVVTRGPRDGPKRLVGYVVAGQAARPTSAALQAFLAQKLPDYMVPATYVFLDALPLTTNGKVNRQALPEPPEAIASLERSPSPHQAGLEQMRELVAGVLGLKDPDPEVSLLAYGATSIDVIRIVNRLDETLGYRPSIGDLYRDLTIKALAASYERTMNERRSAAPQRDTPEREPRRQFVVLTDPTEREDFKRRQTGLRRFDGNVPSVELDGALPDEQAIRQYAERRSYREFLPAPVPFRKLSGLLGKVSPLALASGPKYLFGSPGGSYPVQSYLYAKRQRIELLAAGAYYFDPTNRRLILISGGACIDPEIYDFLINRPVFDSAAFSIFLVAQLDAIEPLYGDRSLSFATIEAGLMTQMLELAAPSYGIGLCQMGGLDQEPLRRPLAFESGHVLVHSLVGGLIADPRELAPEEDSTGVWLEGKV